MGEHDKGELGGDPDVVGYVEMVMVVLTVVVVVVVVVLMVVAVVRIESRKHKKRGRKQLMLTSAGEIWFHSDLY